MASPAQTSSEGVSAGVFGVFVGWFCEEGVGGSCGTRVRGRAYDVGVFVTPTQLALRGWVAGCLGTSERARDYGVTGGWLCRMLSVRGLPRFRLDARFFVLGHALAPPE